MAISSVLRPTRRLVPLFLAVTLAPSVLLVALGWFLFRQDRDSATTQLEARRRGAADLVVAELGLQLTATEQALRDAARRLDLAVDDDAVIVVFSGHAVDVMPSGRVSYLPIAPTMREAGATEFVEGEHLEHRQQNAIGAAVWYRARATSPDAAVRAGALIGLARNLRKTGAMAEALAAYNEAAGIRGVAVADAPVDLLARSARCEVLASTGRTDQLQKEAAALLADLRRGTWRVSAAVYEATATDARAWAGDGKLVVREMLAASVNRLWDRWRNTSRASSRSSGREVDDGPGESTTVVWTREENDLVALVVSQSYVERRWLARLQPALDLQRVRLTLQPVSSTASTDQGGTRRTPSDTGLPWTVVVMSDDEATELQRLAGRRRLWLAGLALLAALLLAGTAVIARAVSRELAAARLQAEFVSAVSHEFRTPLTTMKQLTEALSDERIPAESRRQTYYQALSRQTDRLQRLVESLLDLGRLEAGATPYRMAPVAVMPLVRAVAADFTAESAAGGRDVSVEIAGSDLLVEGDRDALANALWNLLDNAVKYSPDQPAVSVAVELQAGRVAIRVRDRGVGIPRAEQQHIFEKFVRGAQAIAGRIRGTGIGLAIVWHVVTAHGGTVELESEPGTGSTFTVWLPASAGAVQTEEGAVVQKSDGSARLGVEKGLT